MSDQPRVGRLEFAPFGTLTPDAGVSDWRIYAEATTLRAESAELRAHALMCAINGALEALGNGTAVDAYHNLDGAIIDANRAGWDAICRQTTERVRSQLGMALTILADAAFPEGKS